MMPYVAAFPGKHAFYLLNLMRRFKSQSSIHCLGIPTSHKSQIAMQRIEKESKAVETDLPTFMIISPSFCHHFQAESPAKKIKKYFYLFISSLLARLEIP